jgi:hypothetical protein
VFVHPRGHVVARIARRAGSGSGSPGAWARIGILNYVDLIYWHNRKSIIDHFDRNNDDVFMFDCNNHREGQKTLSCKKKTGGHDSCLSTRFESQRCS